MRSYVFATLMVFASLMLIEWMWAQGKADDLPCKLQQLVEVAILMLAISFIFKWYRKETEESRRMREKEGEGSGRIPFTLSQDPSPSSVEWVIEEVLDEGEKEDVNEEEEKGGELTLLVLQDFYATKVHKGRRDPPHDHCDQVKGLVDTLLRRIRTFGPCCAEVLQGGCVGVGSMFEGWGLNRGDQVAVYDVLVLLRPPAGFSLDVVLGKDEQMSDPSNSSKTSNSPRNSASPHFALSRSQTGLLAPEPPQSSESTQPSEQPDEASEPPQPSEPPSSLEPVLPLPDPLPGLLCGTARVIVRKEGPDQSNGARSFCTRTRLADFVDRARVEHIKEGLEYMLEECLMQDQYVEPVRVLSWLGAALRRGWQARGGLKVTFWGREWPCVMRVETKHGRVVYVNVMPAVHVPDSDVVVVARVPVALPCQELWEPCFSSDENYILRKLTSRLPVNSCHMLCLEILAYLNRPPAAFSSRVVTFLSTYHLKTVLFHQLLLRCEPQDWDGAYLVERLGDMLDMLKDSLQERRLLSFWVANSALGSFQPPPFRHSPPLNLFTPLVQHKGWYGLAVVELNQLCARLRKLPGGLSRGPSSHMPRESISVERVSSGHPRKGKQDCRPYRTVRLQPTLKVVTRRLSMGAERRKQPVPPEVRGRTGSSMAHPQGPLFRFSPLSVWEALLKAMGLEEGQGGREENR